MPTFRVPEMSCGHCIHAITQAVQAVDPAARVEADLATATVRVASSAAAARLSAAIDAAGYPNTAEG